MNLKKIILVLVKAIIRIIGLGFLISGLFSLPRLSYEYGFTKDPVTLSLRLIAYLSSIILGYLLIRIKEKSIIAIIFYIILSFVVHFYNLNNSKLYNSMSQLSVYKDTAFYFVILLLFIILKKNLFDNNILKQESNSEVGFFKKNKYILLELFFIILGLLLVYILFKLDTGGII